MPRENERPGGPPSNGTRVANILRSFQHTSETDSTFVPIVGGPRLFMLLLYATVLVGASLEFFTSMKLFYGNWDIYNSFVFCVSGVFVLAGIITLFSAQRVGPDEYSLPVPRLVLGTSGFVMLALSAIALMYWGKNLGSWAILLSVTLLYGFLMMVLANRNLTTKESLRLIMYGTGLVLMILVPVHEAFNVARAPPGDNFLTTLLNLVLLVSGMTLALISIQSMQTRDAFMGAWLIGAMGIFLVAFHEQFGILRTGTYSSYDRTLALIGITFSFVPLAMYVLRERVYLFLWKRLQGANKLIEAGEFKGALKQADAALKQCARVGIEDRFALPWSLKGDALYRMKDYERAMVSYDTALEIDPKDSVSWCHLGNIYALQGKQEQAMHAFDEAIKADSQNPYAWNNKGTIYQSLHMYTDALICFDKAIIYEPRLFDAHMNMARLFSKLGKTSDAVIHYRAALDLRPDSEAAGDGLRKEFFRGQCLDQINGWEQLGLDTTQLRMILEEDPVRFVRRSKEFLAKIVEDEAQLTVLPEKEHIDINRAIRDILKVTDDPEGATIEKLEDVTSLKRRDLVLPLALLVETDHVHFSNIGGRQLYIAKGRAPVKPPEPERLPEPPAAPKPPPVRKPEPVPEPIREPIPEPPPEPPPAVPEPPPIVPEPPPVVREPPPVVRPPPPEPAPVPVPEPEPEPVPETPPEEPEPADVMAELAATSPEPSPKEEELSVEEKTKAEPEPTRELEPEPKPLDIEATLEKLEVTIPEPVPQIVQVKCPGCGLGLTGDESKCPRCDLPLENASIDCPICGEEVSFSTKVCPKCGAQFRGIEQRRPAVIREIPKQPERIVQKILPARGVEPEKAPPSSVSKGVPAKGPPPRGKSKLTKAEIVEKLEKPEKKPTKHDEKAARKEIEKRVRDMQSVLPKPHVPRRIVTVEPTVSVLVFRKREELKEEKKKRR